ncbi:DUF512 domain-containing protein [Alkaliphilus peptidifermentans]|uniref:Putative radical SAM enzyme, TIGR03279 family n=1 Tax=Alkaliphilus peptidifermentans DSM 18978 TaxID=1120976 RepID=A0A1G5BBP6_9FIRM|nr:DUF512 domain-containing protein [Alkaliphilus peptidifermentans]SCX87581.1 putative radical SAM enzyme, TIGR03279 family [Alkaliphilus peptidifermentans DSM 18978]
MKEAQGKNIINHVEVGSIAEELGVEKGDVLISINGQTIEDIIEYKFFIADEYLEIEIEKPDGEQWLLEVEKSFDEDLGIDFENPILTHMRSCQNKCIFCFIDQLPPNMRQSLYFKDDDSRLSFLHGNYITLTNMKKRDIERIIKYRISPINISVHTTNGELRRKMLNNRFSDNIMELLNQLAENQIEMNCQIVLCPNINDKEELDKTLRDLEGLHESIGSVAVVPVGLTRYREALTEIKPFNKEMALETIEQVTKWQRYFHKKFKRNFVYLSDEFYILAKANFPSYDSYDGFQQLENGVGMVVKFREEVRKALKKKPNHNMKGKRVSIVSGTLACEFMKDICGEIVKVIKDIEIDVVCVSNDFFGGHVSVSGLLTGKDILATLSKTKLGDMIVIGENMLKSGEKVFLDDMTVEELEGLTKSSVKVSPVDGNKFLNTILDLE